MAVVRGNSLQNEMTELASHSNPSSCSLTRHKLRFPLSLEVGIVSSVKSLASHRGGPGFEPGSGHVGCCGG
jgi:hypothetical protein